MGYVKVGNNVLTGSHIFIAGYNYGYKNPNKPIMYQGNHFIPRNEGNPRLMIGDAHG